MIPNDLASRLRILTEKAVQPLNAVQEIASVDAFAELVDALPGYAGVLSTDEYSPGEYQKTAFLYRTDQVSVSDPISLASQD